MPEILVTNEKDALTFYGGNLKAFQSKEPYVVLVGPANTGKAQPIDIIVPTPNGQTKFGDLKVGDYVFDEHGKPTKVLEIHEQGYKKSYIVEFADGSSTETCDEHLWLTWTRNQREIYFNKNVKTKRNRTGNPKLLTTSQIKNTINKSYSIPICKPVEYKSNELPIHPYVMGALIGDGHFNKTFTLISSPDDFIINKIRELIGSDYELTKLKANKYDYKLKSKLTFNIFIRYFKDEYIRLDTKYIPDEYLYSSIEDRINLLQGLIDTDGSIGKRDGDINYYTASEKLSQNVRQLVESLGGLCTIKSKIPKYKYKNEIKHGKKYYIIRISLPNNIIPCSLPRKLKNYKSRKKQLLRRIVSITETSSKKMRCISVSNDSGLYLTNNYIVTHNTYCLCWKMHLFALKYPGVKILLTRKSLRALRDSAVRSYQDVLRQSGYDTIVRTLGETRPTNFIYPYAENTDNGIKYKGVSEIILAPLDTKGKALGAQYDMVYVNQPDTEGTTFEEFKLIKSRARLENAPYRQLICDPNPSYDKHWLLLNSKSNINPNGEWELIDSIHQDNPSLYNHELNEWTDLGKEQMKELASLPGHLRDSLYEGKWFSTSGMAFGSYWQPHRHILYLETEEAQKLGVSLDNGDGTFSNIIPKDWHHYLSIDWGFHDPFVALLIAKHPEKDIFIQHKHIYVTNKDINEVAEMTDAMVSGYNIKAIVADRGRAETTVMEGKLGRNITGAIKNNTSNMDSMNICIAELNSDRWKFVETKSSLFNLPDPSLVKKNKPMGFEEIPNLKKDDKTGKIADHQDDHFYDAWKYFCRYISELEGKNKKNRNNKFLWL